jgi:hypothetical protein
LPGSACAAILLSSELSAQPRRLVPGQVLSFDSIGGWFFAADPDQSYLEQTIFWAPEVLATVIPVRPAPVRPPLIAGPHSHVRLDLGNLDGGQLRQGPDGWHAVMHLHGVEHRIWFKEAPIVSAAYIVEYPFDRDFEFRVDAGRRLWRGLNGRPQGKPLHALSAYRRRRLALALRALDARMDGATYREIAEVLLPAHRVAKRDWRTHDVRSRIVRLVKTGFALVQGGYRALLRPAPRKK